MLHRGGPTERDTSTGAAFKAGDRVRAKNIHPLTHTRLPRYVRGHVGVVERVHRLPRVSGFGNAIGARRKSAVALHGAFRRAANCGAPDGDPTLKVSIDAFEPYLEPA